jgi:hypothetical protein
MVSGLSHNLRPTEESQMFSYSYDQKYYHTIYMYVYASTKSFMSEILKQEVIVSDLGLFTPP